MKFTQFGVPILFIGDNPAMFGGLSRIGRDLATLVCTMPEFRVGYLGRGICQDRRLPFVTYDYPEYAGWGDEYLQHAWDNFSEGHNGIIMSLDDISRREGLAAASIPNAQKWMYTPIDSYGPDLCRLPSHMSGIASRFDRVLTASEWGSNVLRDSGIPLADWLPHGIFTSVFRPRPRQVQGPIFGCIMANQSRKCWPVACAVFRDLRSWIPDFRGWFHVDTLKRYWDIEALLREYDLTECVTVTTLLSDDQLAEAYSDCCCTILPSEGEGFGYPIAESLACDTPCIITNYAAGPCLLGEQVGMACSIHGSRVDTVHCVTRVTPSATDMAIRANSWAGLKLASEDWSSGVKGLVEHLDWDKLKYPWMRWFREGLQ